MIIYRSKIKDIIFEFTPPESEEKKGVIIICDGLPSVPKQKDLMSYFSSQGFFVIYPRYSGTWESDGEFLKESPTKDIEDIINLIKTGKIIELYADKEFNIESGGIYLIGSSFGGAVALSLAESKNISKVVALSPIVDFKRHNNQGGEQDLNWLSGFILKAFGQGYRFDNSNWKKMIKGEIFNPPQELKLKKETSMKILILYDKSDESVDYKKIKDYSSKNGIKTIETENIGHLSFSKLSDEIKNKIIDWF
ncbi:MAG: YqiA/YcfP family alpha/beta fold hydrolase [Candidatus Tagabacteria bacterium]